MDFYQILEKTNKGVTEIYPDFKVCRSKDLMIRGKSFYAVWDSAKQIWSTDEYDVQRLIDEDLDNYVEKNRDRISGYIEIKRLTRFSSKIWTNFKTYLNQMADNSHQLDEQLTFANTKIKKTDYISRRLPYILEEAPTAAYDEMMSTLYDILERQKLEWAVGAVIAGEAKDIQKFIVLYGSAGSGKSTFLNILQKLFVGYYTTFDAKALTGNNNTFSTEVFRSNPLVAIQHDGDLSKIEDNTKLNSIVSHEVMTMNEKYKPSYMARINCFLFMGTNKPVKISDSKSGIIRRLIDVNPSGRKLPIKKYHALLSQIDFELGGIAWKCLNVYRSLGKNYYSNYKPLSMMFQTDVFFNFVETHYHFFKNQPEITLSQAYEMYKTYCDETLIEFKLPRHKFRDELKSYFENFHEVSRIDNKQVRSVFSGFLVDKFTSTSKVEDEPPYSLVLENTTSIFDVTFADFPAQYATSDGVPEKKWLKIETKLSDIDTSRLHYVKLPPNYIVIDFDLKDEMGFKSLNKNLEAASKWPSTYSEFSKSGLGVHLHYFYTGDISSLNRLYSDGIEIKTFVGNSSLRRKFTKANNIPIAKIGNVLPLKEKRPVLNFDSVQSELGIRDLVHRNLRKEIHPGTKPSIDFIHKILTDAYTSNLEYDITDLRPAVLAFANNSTNNSDYCIKLVNKMLFKSKEKESTTSLYLNDTLIFFDVEVFPNLLVVVWKAEGKSPVKLFNPKPSELEELMRFKLIGFNCRRYDNHILYARYIGYDNHQIYTLSQKIINNSKNCFFKEAYNLSYADVYDFSSKKQSLKKFQIELGLTYKELQLPWDQPAPEDKWGLIGDYCENDVITTESVFFNRQQDFIARSILSDLSGFSINDTTQTHVAKIIFGGDSNPNREFIYTDLNTIFPGYKYDAGVSTYQDEIVGEGGYVYSEPGIYHNALVFDILSMHPTSLVLLNLFGKYTKNFKDLLDLRVAIKEKRHDVADILFDGKFKKYLNTEKGSAELSYALKIIINSVYGLTFAKFDNKFKDFRNKDNIVAKRGALFMIDLKNAIQRRGDLVFHIKTDSIKVINQDPDFINFIFEFAAKYGYTFQEDDRYEKICLINDAVYIAKRKDGDWIAVGPQFAHPFIFKTLFSKQEVVFEDLCEYKSVSTTLYLDFNEDLPLGEHNYHFVGKSGLFVPVKNGGGILLREKDGKYHSVTGTKGWRWLEASVAKELKPEIDFSYYRDLLNDAQSAISKYGDLKTFLNDSTSTPPWLMPCGNEQYNTCFVCPRYYNDDHHTNCNLGYDLSDLFIIKEKKELNDKK